MNFSRPRKCRFGTADASVFARCRIGATLVKARSSSRLAARYFIECQTWIHGKQVVQLTVRANMPDEIADICKACSVCGVTKPSTDFHKKSGAKDGLCSACKPCAVLRSKAWHEQNRQRAILSAKQRYERNKDAALNYRKEWRSRTVEYRKKYAADWKEKNRDKVNSLNRKWKANNAPAVTMDHARRRASKLTATPSWADTSRIKAIYIQARKLSESTGNLYTVDHIVPLRSSIVCGLHCESNLQVMLRTENIRKSNKWWPDMP